MYPFIQKICWLAPLVIVLVVQAAPEKWVREQGEVGDFPLVRAGKAAEMLISADDHRVVKLAAEDFARDVERVTGATPTLRTDGGAGTEYAVLVGTLGKSPQIDALVAERKLDVSSIRGSWETFLIAVVPNPLPGVKLGLVLVGSDRRATAYALYELAQAIGVSPWHWWADVAPDAKNELHVAAGTRKWGPPSVRYRGIFLNDEDWGMQPWAAKTFAPEEGDIGPKTYAKVFELLLRLKANTLWPAMHECTRPFNGFPENARLADDYAIVMGSSHAEPMLRNNVGEWTAPKDTYDYVNNREGVHRYWEERVASNAAYENIYTLGMRGIHDSRMIGPKDDAERIATLQKIFADQRAMLAQHVNPAVEKVPQMFCAYKEVLNLYRRGLTVPDDVTIVWPDDNFGYIRNFANAEEHRRAGGFGVYYHISYLGHPLSYLWLCTTPPALIWEEMSKAYEHGADRIWIVNVGDLKPAEIGTEFFLQMAWDVGRWSRENLPAFLPEWAAREFGAACAEEVAAVMAEYYRLNFQRKPEHLQWWLPGRPPRHSALTARESHERLQAFASLKARVDEVQKKIPSAKGDAFYELVVYPVRGSALANERFIHGEQGMVEAAVDAHQQLIAETAYFNERLAGGKWRHFMSLEPADDSWKSMRIARWTQPTYPPAPEEAENVAGGVSPTAHDRRVFEEQDGYVSIEAEHFTRKTDARAAGWQVIAGLGRTGDAVAVFPTRMPSVVQDRLATDAPCLEYTVHFKTAGEATLLAQLLPTHPLVGGQPLRLAVSLGDDPVRLLELAVDDGGDAWRQGVLNATRTASIPLKIAAAGEHTLRIYGTDAGVVVDKLLIDRGGLKPSYLGPPETLRAPR